MSDKRFDKPKQKGGFIQGLPIPVAQPTKTGGCCGGGPDDGPGGCCGESTGAGGGCCGETVSATNSSTNSSDSCCG
jgi:hypothetical protein